MSDQPVTDWLQLHRSGDSDATRLLFEHFAPKLARLAHAHLTARDRQRADGEDVVQSVFLSFVRRDAQGEFRISSGDDLWKLLVTITLRKARAIWRKNRAEFRDVNRETAQSDSDGDWLTTAMSREPTPVEALVLAEQIESVLDGLTSAHARALQLRLAGFSPTEAAQTMNISRQAFYRLLEPLRDRLRGANQMADA